MSKKNDDFFAQKKPWSEVKDDLLKCYLKPYVQKILCTKRPLVYVDCFAGKGKFDDGKLGSPIIAMNTIRECLGSTKATGSKVYADFIELNHAIELEENMEGYPEANVIQGKYEEKIDELLDGRNGCNVFLYIDPYGIKCLDYSKFEKFAKQKFNSIELLINLNSFGFIRNGCRAIGMKDDAEEAGLFDDLVERDPTVLDASEKSVSTLNKIAGGDYWVDIIEQRNSGQINTYEAEELFAEQYCRRLNKDYKYVLNMPIRIRRGQQSKYRMIHATNHQDGCVLMVDNMCNRGELMKKIQTGGQISLFEEDINNRPINDEAIRMKVADALSSLDGWAPLNRALAEFYTRHGVICKKGRIEKMLKEFEKTGRIMVQREPSFTKNGRPSYFMSEERGQKVSIRWVR